MTKKFILVLTLLVALTVKLFAQGSTGQITFSPGADNPVPEQLYWYEFQPPNQSWETTNCTYNWITNGQSVFTTSDGSSVGDFSTEEGIS